METSSVPVSSKDEKKILLPALSIGFVAALSIILANMDNYADPAIGKPAAVLSYTMILFTPVILLGLSKGRKAGVLALVFGLIWLAVFVSLINCLSEAV